MGNAMRHIGHSHLSHRVVSAERLGDGTPIQRLGGVCALTIDSGHKIVDDRNDHGHLNLEL